MPDRSKYRHIVAWGKLLGSYPYYIEMQVDEAIKDNAPANAIYKAQDGTWHTYEGITNPDSRARMDALLESKNV